MVLRTGIPKQSLAGNNKPLAEVVEPRTSLVLLDFTGQVGRRTQKLPAGMAKLARLASTSNASRGRADVIG